MARYDYDLFVIGAGSGGVRGARMAAATGARVGIAEEFRYGGTCVIRGCVPKKLLVYASHFHEDFADAAGFGWQVPEARFDWPTLIANKDQEIARLEGIYRRLLDGAGVEMYDGRAVLVDPHTVEVGGRRMTAGIVLVATGGRPFNPGPSGHRARHHLQRGLPPLRAAAPRRGRRRRLHRRRVRRDLQRPGLRGDADLPRPPGPARLRRGRPRDGSTPRWSRRASPSSTTPSSTT